MKIIAAIIAGLSLTTFGAEAADEVKVEGHRNADGTGQVKTSRKHRRGKTTDTTTTNHKVSKDVGGGSTETKDSMRDHDTGSGGHDTKSETKETIKRDSTGKVIEHDTKTTQGK